VVIASFPMVAGNGDGCRDEGMVKPCNQRTAAGLKTRCLGVWALENGSRPWESAAHVKADCYL